MTRKNVKPRKSTLYEDDFQYNSDGIPPGGLFGQMDGIVNMLPEDTKPYGKQIMAILRLSVIAIFGIFLIGAFVATFTGHSDQIMNIFSADITLVGIVVVGAILLIIRKKIQ
jgi:hypothetical protein